MDVWGLESAFICLFHVQIAVLEEQKNEAAENEASDKVEDEANKSYDVEPMANAKGELLDEKPDINDVPMEESQVNCFYNVKVLHMLNRN